MTAAGPTSPTPTGPRAARGTRLLRIGVAAGLTGLAVLTGATRIQQEATLTAQQARIDDLAQRLTARDQEDGQAVEAGIRTGLGLRRDRLEADRPRLTDLARTAFTWDTGAAYLAARDRLQTRYRLAATDPFLRDFLPAPRTIRAADGTLQYELDATGVNSAVDGDPEITVIAVRADRYAYAVRVDVAITADTVTGTAGVTGHRPMLLRVDTDATGAVLALTGAAGTAQARRSG
ncbi:hypothetical protein [Granulicoccus phenolivorans]|uniref:hypothetical protein n=1 Tax=Granulicoccus phenolivorans TaxID=266854 RepID=UPI00041E1DCE|nr:hypothetical protein [Granulicoccus phenolivorans]